MSAAKVVHVLLMLHNAKFNNQSACSTHPPGAVLPEGEDGVHDAQQFPDHQLLLSQHVVPFLPLQLWTLGDGEEGEIRE